MTVSRLRRRRRRRRRVLALTVPALHREHAVSHQQAQQQQQPPVASHFVSSSLTVSAPRIARYIITGCHVTAAFARRSHLPIAALDATPVAVSSAAHRAGSIVQQQPLATTIAAASFIRVEIRAAPHRFAPDQFPDDTDPIDPLTARGFGLSKFNRATRRTCDDHVATAEPETASERERARAPFGAVPGHSVAQKCTRSVPLVLLVH